MEPEHDRAGSRDRLIWLVVAHLRAARRRSVSGTDRGRSHGRLLPDGRGTRRHRVAIALISICTARRHIPLKTTSSRFSSARETVSRRARLCLSRAVPRRAVRKRVESESLAGPGDRSSNPPLKQSQTNKSVLTKTQERRHDRSQLACWI